MPFSLDSGEKRRHRRSSCRHVGGAASDAGGGGRACLGGSVGDVIWGEQHGGGEETLKSPIITMWSIAAFSHRRSTIRRLQQGV